MKTQARVNPIEKPPRNGLVLGKLGTKENREPAILQVYVRISYGLI